MINTIIQEADEASSMLVLSSCKQQTKKKKQLLKQTRQKTNETKNEGLNPVSAWTREKKTTKNKRPQYMRQHQYSRSQIGWHRILRLSLKIEYQVCQDPHGIDFGTVCEMILIINPMGTILVCWFFLETISRFGATPPAIGCKKNTMFIFNCCKQWKVVVFQKRDSND